ncbi:MAG: localization factor PodJL, partial [Alphaproteobacteria bacterium]
GDGIKRSHALAARWFRKAAAKNFAPSLYQLGLVYELGLDYRANKRRALDWYNKAATAGSAVAADKVRALEAAGVLPTVLAPAPRSAVRRAAPQKKAPPQQAALSGAGIAEIQRLLKSLDFDPGTADGKLGTKTTEAIRLYQGMAGLPVDGRVSQKLLDQIRKVTGTPKP